MSFDWSSFLSLATELPTLKTKAGMEAILRTCVSRGYYGAFHLVRQKLLAQDTNLKFSPDANAHQEVVQHLKTSRDMERMKLGTEIGRLRQYRNSADYEDTIADVTQWHNMATATLESIENRIAKL